MQQRVMSTVLSFIEPLITAVLGRYIEGDIAKCLLFHRWGVEFKSENVKLKGGALDELGLPISIKKGFLQLLHIMITYTFHIDVNINGVFLLIYPQHSHKHFDTKSNHRQKNAIKKSLLNRAEQRMLETEWKFLSSSMSYGELFVRNILKHFVKNIKLNITDIHIRYQDITTIPNHSFVFGATIKRIIFKNDKDDDDIKSDDDNDKTTNFLDSYLMENLDTSSESDTDINDNDDNNGNFDEELDRKVITKTIVVDSLSIYNDIMQNKDKNKKDIIWHYDEWNDDELKRKFEFIPSKQLRISSYNYLLKPFSMEFNMFLHENFRGYIDKYPHDPSKWRPNIESDINVDLIDVTISTKQIFALDLWSFNWKIIKKKMKYHELMCEMKDKRPQSDDRKRWWQYLIKCALKYNDNEFKLSNIMNFEYKKNRYILFYKRKMRPYKYRYWLKDLDATEKKELDRMEIAFPYSQILMFRCIAIAELKKEMEKRDKYQELLKVKHAQEQANSYMLTKLFYATQSLVSAPQESPQQYILDKYEVDDVMFRTDFIKQIEEDMKYPDSYILCHFGLFLDEINIQFQDDENSNIGLVQIAISTQFDIRSHSYLSRIQLNKMDLCLGSKRDLKDKSLFQALLTPITLQIDIETDSLDINKNKVSIHDVAVIELLLNPHIIKSNAQKIEVLANDIKGMIKRHYSNDDDDNVIHCNDIVLTQSISNQMEFDYFVALHSIHKLCDIGETTICGFWVYLESNGVKDENVFLKNKELNHNNVSVIKLKNVLRIKHKYLRIETNHIESKEDIEWIVNDNEQFLSVIQETKRLNIAAKH